MTGRLRIVHRLYAALASGDGPALKELVAPQIRLEASVGLPHGLGGVHEGSAAVRRDFWGRINELFDVTAQVHDVQPIADGRVLVLGRYVGRARGPDGAEVDAAFAHVLTIEDGRLVALTQVTDSRRWSLRATGSANIEATAGHRARSGGTEHDLTALELTVADGVATITLQRPDRHNAIDPAFTRDLLEAVTRCAERNDVRAVLILAEGPSFTVGGDMTVFRDLDGPAFSTVLRRMIDDYHRALQRMTEMAAPVVVAVEGPAAGGGLGMVLAADVVVASHTSSFVMGYTALGLTADGGTSWLLPRIAGWRLAQRMFLLNEQLDAEAALAAGLVTEVMPAAAVRARAGELTAQLAAGPRHALGGVKRLLATAASTSFADQLNLEQRLICAAAETDDALEGVAAFTQRRPPSFGGA